MFDLGQHLQEPAQPTQPLHSGNLQQQGQLEISDLEQPESHLGPALVSKTIQEVRVSSGREDFKHPVQSNVNFQQNPRGSVTQSATSQESRSASVTQVMSHAAHVNVPRPTPLVQNTVQPQRNGQADLTSQIAQLNKQHDEAQKRLQALLQQQQTQQNQREIAPQLGPYKLAVSASSQPQQISHTSGLTVGVSKTQQAPNRFIQQQQIPHVQPEIGNTQQSSEQASC